MKNIFCLCILMFFPLLIMAGPNEDLFDGINKGDIGKVKLALNKGADVNAIDKSGDPIFFLAVFSYNKDILNLFIDHGVDVNKRSKDGQSALFRITAYSARNTNDNIKSIEILKILLKKGIDVNVKDEMGSTALTTIIGASSNELDINQKFPIDVLVSTLLKVKGININEKDSNGMSALHHAASQGKEKIVKILIDHGADANIKDVVGNTPLDLAESKGYHSIMDLLKSKMH